MYSLVGKMNTLNLQASNRLKTNGSVPYNRQ